MQLVTRVDRSHASFDNEAMYKGAAEKVKAWRKAHGEMNQVEFASLAKVSVGCLQGFEAATRATREKNLLKIAKTIGLHTKEELLSDDGPQPPKPDPLLKDLRPEDLRLANHFHHAGADAKHAVKEFLSPEVSDERREQIAVVLERLLHLPASSVSAIAVAVPVLEQLLLPTHQLADIETWLTPRAVTFLQRLGQLDAEALADVELMVSGLAGAPADPQGTPAVKPSTQSTTPPTRKVRG